jgi:hypothetical protein
LILLISASRVAKITGVSTGAWPFLSFIIIIIWRQRS